MAAVAGGAGVGSWLRAWGQNRNERHGTLTNEQRDFREAQRQALQDLRSDIQSAEGREQFLLGRFDEIDARNNRLITENTDLRIDARLKEAENVRLFDQLTVSFASNERYARTVAELKDTVERQAGEITRLQRQVVTLQDEIALLRRTPGEMVSGD
jgi:chromosome segregation ATPase